MSAPQRHVVSWPCVCGKVGYESRRDAQRKARQINHRDLHAYRCTHASIATWHLGHLPRDVTNGRITRAQIRPQAIRGGAA